MKVNPLFSVLLLVAGFLGILFTSSAIFFGLLTAGGFLFCYNSIIRTEGKYESSLSAIPEIELNRIKFCPECGTSLELDAISFCPNCGEKVK